MFRFCIWPHLTLTICVTKHIRAQTHFSTDKFMLTEHDDPWWYTHTYSSCKSHRNCNIETNTLAHTDTHTCMWACAINRHTSTWCQALHAVCVCVRLFDRVFSEMWWFVLPWLQVHCCGLQIHSAGDPWPQLCPAKFTGWGRGSISTQWPPGNITHTHTHRQTGVTFMTHFLNSGDFSSLLPLFLLRLSLPLLFFCVHSSNRLLELNVLYM